MNYQSSIKTNLIVFVIAFFGWMEIHAQTTTTDILFLKNSNVVYGTITQRSLDNAIWIKTTKGSLLFKIDEIQKIRRRNDHPIEPPTSIEPPPIPPPPPPETDEDLMKKKMLKAKQTQDVSNAAPIYSTSSENLYMEYYFDCNYLLKKYDNKIISVRGKIIRADSTGIWGTDSTGQYERIKTECYVYCIFLQGGDVLNTGNEIMCLFDDPQANSVANLFVGNYISVKGRFIKNSTVNSPSECECSRMDFQLLHCIINK